MSWSELQTGVVSEMVTPPPTERLRFRRYKVTDIDAVVEMFADDEAKRWYPTKSQPEEAERWIEWNRRNYDQHGVGLWAITFQRVGDDELLEIGYHLQAKHRGKGYALESARSCADFAIGVLNAPTVCSIVDPRNGSSMRVAEAIHASMRTFVDHHGKERNLYFTDNGFRTRPTPRSD